MRIVCAAPAAAAVWATCLRPREAAGLLQAEVDKMMQDVGRLDERIRKLATHFSQAEKDIEDIQTSTRKITSRGGRITQIDVSEDEAPPVLPGQPGD